MATPPYLTINEARVKIAALETVITAALQKFQAETGLVIHSVPISEWNKDTAVTVRVKVQL